MRPGGIRNRNPGKKVVADPRLKTARQLESVLLGGIGTQNIQFLS